MVEGTPQIGFMQDQNNDPKGVYAGVLIGDTYVFPPLRLVPGEIPVPAYDATDTVNAPLKIKKTLTAEDVPNLMEAGYTEEMANWLVKNAPDFAVRGRQLVRMKNNKVTAYLGPDGQWVKEETRFEIMPKLTFDFLASGGVPPYISQEDIDSLAWLHWVMRQTQSIAPNLPEIIRRPVVRSDRDLRYDASRQEETDFWTNEESRMSKRVSWASTDSSFDNGSPFDTVKAVVFYPKDGSLIWAVEIAHSNPGLDRLTDLPNISVDFSQTSRKYSDEMGKIFEEWDLQNEVPKSAEFKIFCNYSAKKE